MPADLQTFRKNFTFTKGLWTIGPLLPQSPSPFLRPSSPVPVPGSFFYTIPPPSPHPAPGVSPRIAAKLVPVPTKDCQTSIWGIFRWFFWRFSCCFLWIKIVCRWFPLASRNAFVEASVRVGLALGLLRSVMDTYLSLDAQKISYKLDMHTLKAKLTERWIQGRYSFW